jgi:hypothetical protein
MLQNVPHARSDRRLIQVGLIDPHATAAETQAGQRQNSGRRDGGG